MNDIIKIHIKATDKNHIETLLAPYKSVMQGAVVRRWKSKKYEHVCIEKVYAK